MGLIGTKQLAILGLGALCLCAVASAALWVKAEAPREAVSVPRLYEVDSAKGDIWVVDRAVGEKTYVGRADAVLAPVWSPCGSTWTSGEESGPGEVEAYLFANGYREEKLLEMSSLELRGLAKKHDAAVRRC